MTDFVINNIVWHINYVDTNNPKLIRSDGSRTVGMTDWNTCTIYLANNLRGNFKERVLCHELCHCICFSYNVKMNIKQEELLADWVSLYGREVIDLLDDLLHKSKERKYYA